MRKIFFSFLSVWYRSEPRVVSDFLLNFEKSALENKFAGIEKKVKWIKENILWKTWGTTLKKDQESSNSLGSFHSYTSNKSEKYLREKHDIKNIQICSQKFGAWRKNYPLQSKVTVKQKRQVGLLYVISYIFIDNTVVLSFTQLSMW